MELRPIAVFLMCLMSGSLLASQRPQRTPCGAIESFSMEVTTPIPAESAYGGLQTEFHNQFSGRGGVTVIRLDRMNTAPTAGRAGRPGSMSLRAHSGSSW